MDRSALSAWLRLTLAPGIGGQTQRKLLAAFGLPEQIFSAGPTAVRAVIQSKSDALFDFDPQAAVDRTMAWLDQGNTHFLTLGDADYPAALLEIPDPPSVLYVRGDLNLLKAPGLAIVGSRNATPLGLKTAEDFAQTLAEGGLTIISGLALGIDAAAHRGALARGGKTVAVIGTGADRLYPASNRELALRVAEQGAIVSEFPLGTPAQASNFPRRNRIISGLARGVLVVEAAPESGSLITARLAAEQGREVFAIPGSIHSPLSRGCHKLIKQGAKLVESATDILEEMRLPAPSLAVASHLEIEALDHPILSALGGGPLTLDDLCGVTGLATDELLSQLLTLELDGRLGTLPGNRYQRLN